MKGHTASIALAVLACSAASLVACTLDFDRYDPDGGGRDASLGDGSSGPSARDATPGSDGARDGGAPAADARAEASPNGGDAACAAPAACMTQATSCGATCGQQLDECNARCGNVPACTQTCTSTEQSCLGRCATTCIDCAEDAGCPSSGACLDAAKP